MRSGYVISLVVTILSQSLASAAFGADDYSEENLRFVAEVFQIQNEGKVWVKSCECLVLDEISETTMKKFPAPEFKVFRIVGHLETASGDIRVPYTLAHRVGSGRAGWYGSHLKFMLKPIDLPK